MVKQIFSAKSNKLTRAFRGKQVQIGYMKNLPLGIMFPSLWV